MSIMKAQALFLVNALLVSQTLAINIVTEERAGKHKTTETENLHVHGDMLVDRKSLLKNHLRVKAGATIEENLKVEGKGTIDKSLTVKKDLTVKDNATIEGNLTVEGTLDAGNIVITEITTACGSTLDCDLFVQNDAEIGHNLTVDNDATVDGTLTVVGTVTADCNLSVGCNIEMVESTDALHGNVTKAGNSFISNFGTDNTFVGENSGNFTLTVAGAIDNTGFGTNVLQDLTTGGNNTAVGYNALTEDTTGSDNSAFGFDALETNTTGVRNTAVGSSALATANPVLVGDAQDLTAVGYHALFSNTTGRQNTAVGSSALAANTTGIDNTAVGYEALLAFSGSPTVGNPQLTAIGANALDQLIGGATVANIVAVGFQAGHALAAGTEHDDIYIGNPGVTGESDTIRIGAPTVGGVSTQTAAYIAGIFNAGVGALGQMVSVDNTGKLGTVVSSARFKKNIAALNPAEILQRLLKLVPSSFVYKSDKNESQQFGLIAEEVDTVFPELVVRDAEGNIMTVRYMELISLLLAAVKGLNERIEDLEQQA